MNFFSPTEIIENYLNVGAKKTHISGLKLFLLGILAGFIIGMGSAVTNTAAHSVDNVSAARIISGLLFPFGLGVVMLLGAELFTGNCMIPISVFEKKATYFGLLKNWFFVYLGNLFGGVLLSAACVYSGQLNYSNGELALYTIKLAVFKSSLDFWPALILGILCNVLVCAGVLCSMSAKDTSGKILGAYIPVAFFVLCGFEHCVANMYYIPAGLMALDVPRYMSLAIESGVNIELLSWSAFFIKNLLPVTIGNIVGAILLASILWFAHFKKSFL